MDLIDYQEKLIWAKLTNGKNLLEQTTYNGVSYWWNVDYLFYNFLRLTTESRGEKFSITRRNAFTTKLFGSRIGIYVFLLLEIALFFFGKLISLVVWISKEKESPKMKEKPGVIVISYDAAWVATPSYLSGVVRKSDHLKDSVMEFLKDKVNFFGTSSFRYRKASVKIALERALFWDYSYSILNTNWTPKSWLKQKKSHKYFRKQWKTIEKDQSFKKLCKFDDLNLYSPIINEFKYYFFFLLPLCISWVETFTSMIEKYDPSLVFISNESGHSEKSLIIAAKNKKIPILAIQHGVIVSSNRGYIFSKKDISKNGFHKSPFNPIADKVAVFGTQYMDLLMNTGNFPEGSVVVTGNPKFDKLVQMVDQFNDKNQIRRWLNLPDDKPIVIWTTQTHWLSEEENRKNIDAIYSSLKELKSKFNLIIKLHPNEDQQAPLYRQDPSIDPIILGRGSEILQLIYISDILITKHSMTATEAVALNKPVVILNLSGNPDVIDCVDRRVAFGVYQKEDLSNTILRLLEDDKELEVNRPDYVRSEFYQIDGKSSERLGKLMMKMIGIYNKSKNS
ncbi:MAG: CDP-glycerol glycerophosphotransferase family protein [Candidatus Hodarchaeales archaeon]